MKTPRLDGWIPIRLYWQESRLMADWCYLGTTLFSAPFFDQTIEITLRHPFNLLFRRQTPIDVLGEWQVAQPGLPPTGFIFHMSRCGSTLISQMLSALPQNVVVSEAGPIDFVLRAHFRDPRVTDDQRVPWLQWLVSALGQRRHGHEKYFFIKFDSWHTIDLPLIRRAFPSVPWIFVYRDPVEVIVSILRQTPARMYPGQVEPSLLGLDAATVFQMRQEEYVARMLAKFCEVALENRRSAAKLINYRQLPEVVWSELLDLFRVTHTPADLERMSDVSQLNAKDPSTHFADDSESKRQDANDLVIEMADRWVMEPYECLEAARSRSR